MEGIYANSRGNARTPMHWDASEHAGFSHGKPWMKINPNYREINVAAALDDPGSIFHHYRTLIRLRKEYPVIVYGDYRPLLDAHPQVFAYERQLGDQRIVVINNFSGQPVALELPADLRDLAGESLVSNYGPRNVLGQHLTLQPYESFAIALDTQTT